MDGREGFDSAGGQLLNSLVLEVFQEHRVPVAANHLPLTPEGTLKSTKREAQWIGAGGPFECPLDLILEACCAHIM